MDERAFPCARATRPGFRVWLNGYGPTLWAAAVALIGLYFLILSNDIVPARPGRLGAAFWPRAILILLVITAAYDCFLEIRKVPGRVQSFAAAGAKQAARPRIWWLMALGLVLTLSYVNLATVLGFPLANLLFMFIFMLIGGFRRPVAATVIAVVGTTVLVLLFVRIVYVSLPLGIPPFSSLTLLLYSLLGIV